MVKSSMPFRRSASAAFQFELVTFGFDLEAFVDNHPLFEGVRDRIRFAAEVSAGGDSLEFAAQLVKLIRLYGTLEIQKEVDEFEQRIARIQAHPLRMRARKKVG
ncbi:MAG: hypothetical protein AAB425_01850 [Bdellovibrionota bacterium]